MGGPGAASAGGRGFEGTAQHVALTLALEVEGFAAVGNLELEMIAAHETFDGGGAVAGEMNHQFAVEEAVGLRPQPQFHLGAAGTANTVDGAGGEGGGFDAGTRSGGTAGQRIDQATAAWAAATADAAAVVGHPGVGDDAELALREVLAVEIKVDGVLSGQERATGGVADATAEDGAVTGALDGLDVIDAAEGAAVRTDVGRVDAVLIVIEIEEAIVEDHAPADEQDLGDVEDAGGAGERGAVLGAVDELDIFEGERPAHALFDHSEALAFRLALGVLGASGGGRVGGGLVDSGAGLQVGGHI